MQQLHVSGGFNSSTNPKLLIPVPKDCLPLFQADILVGHVGRNYLADDLKKFSLLHHACANSQQEPFMRMSLKNVQVKVYIIYRVISCC